MMLRSIVSGVAFVLMSGAALAAPVATLGDIAGSVLVDQGRGFTLVSASADLLPGSRIMLSKNGVATLVYLGADGCRQKLLPNTITTVGSTALCKPVAQVGGQGPVVVGGPARPSALAVPPAPPLVPPPIPPIAVGVGLAVAGASGLALALALAEKKQPSASN